LQCKVAAAALDECCQLAPVLHAVPSADDASDSRTSDGEKLEEDEVIEQFLQLTGSMASDAFTAEEDSSKVASDDVTAEVAKNGADVIRDTRQNLMSQEGNRKNIKRLVLGSEFRTATRAAWLRSMTRARVRGPSKWTMSEHGRYQTFEAGPKGHLKELLAAKPGQQIDLVILASKKKRSAAPTPEEFGRTLQGFVTKIKDKEGQPANVPKRHEADLTKGKEGQDQDLIIETSRKYTEIFNKAMGLTYEHKEDYRPSLDGGIDAMVELLDDVRTSAWNFAAFVFRRG